MTITQTCRCGSSFTIETDDPDQATIAVSVWQGSHYCDQAAPRLSGFQLPARNQP